MDGEPSAGEDGTPKTQAEALPMDCLADGQPQPASEDSGSKVMPLAGAGVQSDGEGTERQDSGIVSPSQHEYSLPLTEAADNGATSPSEIDSHTGDDRTAPRLLGDGAAFGGLVGLQNLFTKAAPHNEPGPKGLINFPVEASSALSPASQGRTLGTKSDEPPARDDDADSSSSGEKHERDLESPTAAKRRREADREKRLARFGGGGGGSSSSLADVSPARSLSADSSPVRTPFADGGGRAEAVVAGQRVRTKSETGIESDRAKRLAHFGQRPGSSGGSAAASTPVNASSAKSRTSPLASRPRPAGTAPVANTVVQIGSSGGHRRQRTVSETEPEGRPLHEWAKDWIAMVLGVKMSADTNPSRLPDLSCGSLSTDCITAYGVAVELSGNVEYSPRSLVESCIMARLNTEEPHRLNAFQYLLKCFASATELVNTLRKGSPLRPLLTEVRDLAVSYSRIVIEDASMFEELAETHHLEYLAQRVHQASDTAKGLPTGFVAALLQFCASADEGSSFGVIFGPVLVSLRNAALKQTTINRVLPSVLALRDLCIQSPKFAELVLQHPTLTASPAGGMRNGRTFETETLLGPFFRGTVIPVTRAEDAGPADPSVGNFTGVEYYAEGGRGADAIADAAAATHATVRQTLGMLSQALADTTLALLKVKTLRGRVLDFLSMYLRYNHTRVRAHGALARVVSDGFALSIGSVFVKLCEKFTNPSRPSFSKIDSTYLFHEDVRVKHVSESPLVPDVAKGLSEWAETQDLANKKPNFVTEIFFMAINSVHIGIVPLMDRYSFEWIGRRSQLSRVAAQLDAAESAHEQGQLETMLSQLTTVKCCFDAQLLDTNMVEKYLHFYTFVILWLFDTASTAGAGPALDPTPPVEVAALPEYFVADFTTFLEFVARNMPELLDQNIYLSALVKCIVMLLGHPSYVHNPYQRAKLVEVLSMYAPGRQMGRISKFFDAAVSDALAVQLLPSALMQFYIDAETTDYFGKLTMRHNCEMILKDLWQAPRSRQGLIEASKGEGFIRFVMLLVNDTTFLLDDAREALQKIHDCRKAIASADWFTKTEEDKADVQKKLRNSESQARASFQLADETLNLFGYLTTGIIEPFLRPELVSRLAAMLNYNIVALVGPKAQTVPVEHPEEYGFYADRMVAQLVDIYLHLSCIQSTKLPVQETFVAAVAEDERSFDRDILLMAIPRLDIGRRPAFDRLVNRTHSVWVAANAAATDLGEVPAEYEDAITYALMSDPVKLPSGVTVDRKTIASHLLSDPTDPFNRAPLTLEMLVSDEKLKADITAWVEQKTREAATERKSATAK